MDVDVAGWILEFVLRQNSVGDRTLNDLIYVLPLLPDHNLTLKKTLLLRKIESILSKGRAFDKILELLEVIEELDKKEGVMEVSGAMKAAYCGVAIHCSLRVLLEGKDGRRYGDVMKTIWKDRAQEMETIFEVPVGNASGMGLVSDELKRWMVDVKTGVWETSVCENVSMGKYSRRREVVDVVRGYVAEAKEKMGPPFLELAAEKMSEDAMRNLMHLPKVNTRCDQGVVRSEEAMRKLMHLPKVNWGCDQGVVRSESSSPVAALLRRRPRKSWSIEEENVLWVGVKKYGKGNWKLILNMYPDIFVGRSMVDLKDKWRNMSRYESYFESKNVARG